MRTLAFILDRPYSGIPSGARIITFALVTALGLAPASVTNATDANLIAWWEFDEGSGPTAYDSVGTNHGTIYGAQWASGIVGSALSLDGVDAYVEVADDSSLDVTEGTLVGWIKSNVSLQNDKGVVAKSGAVSATDGDYGFIIWSNKIQPIYKGLRREVGCSEDVVGDKGWHHIAVVYDSCGIHVFVDGHLDGESPSYPSPISTNDYSLVIGEYHSTGYNFKGVIDDARIADRAPSVVVFCQEIAPDTVAESMSPTCTLRQYLDVGGKTIWYADTPFWQQGHADGTTTVWDRFGPINILGFYAADGPSDSWDEVTLTAEGIQWGLTETWQSIRPVSTDGVRVLAVDDSGYAAAWVKHYVSGDTYRGFVRLFDRDGDPNINDVRCVAEYPHVPE
ncbi:MAG: LamG domain-containing protein [Planctomycetota bacterium]|jgi:hypothetical protein